MKTLNLTPKDRDVLMKRLRFLFKKNAGLWLRLPSSAFCLVSPIDVINMDGSAKRVLDYLSTYQGK